MEKSRFINAIEAAADENPVAGKVMAFMIATAHGADPEIRSVMLQMALEISEQELELALETLEKHGFCHAATNATSIPA